ncbi:hypothetical protein Vadar_011513 [Vaccinium darrowii]|uniref:Uncharacterized protein n=1 Tax=Vaccinium darrowii TaxID=229202 RepID=A0ACB7XA19_9ERIC|nr:hypothetical protein Vadar_011513 [Vaccinium darrowii]
MAALQLPVCLSIASLLISPSHSQTCNTPQSFSNGKLYVNYMDINTLNTTLFWTYYTTTSSLFVAFLAPPPTSNGWVAWGINPTAPKMLCTQALLAHRQTFEGASSMVVWTFNLNSLALVFPSAISYAVSDVSTEYVDRKTRIFATLALPPNTTTVNHVWNARQESVGTLELVKSSRAGLGSSTLTTASPRTKGHSGGDRI